MAALVMDVGLLGVDAKILFLQRSLMNWNANTSKGTRGPAPI